MSRSRVKGEPILSRSEFFNVDLPGELHEINLNNLAAIMGKEKVTSKTGELTPEQKSLLRTAATPEERSGYRNQFVRDRVQELRDDFTKSAQKRVEQVRKIKQLRGIPADHSNSPGDKALRNH